MAVESKDMMAMMKMDQGMDAPTPTLPPSEQGAATPPMASLCLHPRKKRVNKKKRDSTL
jgi:hypothetical protein